MQRMRSPYLPTFASAASARKRSNQTDGTSLAPRASRQMRRVQCVDADGWTKGTLKRSCDFKRPMRVADPSSNERDWRWLLFQISVKRVIVAQLHYAAT